IGQGNNLLKIDRLETFPLSVTSRRCDRNVGCGASAYSLIEWQYQGVLYDVGIKGGDEADLLLIANSAISVYCLT
ncbi:MAG: hypothetical protein WBV73_29370, partial [Phormidium sp.]